MFQTIVNQTTTSSVAMVNKVLLASGSSSVNGVGMGIKWGNIQKASGI